MLSTLLVVGVISHLWCAARLVGIAHHSFYSVEEWKRLMKQKPAVVGATTPFAEALHLFATASDVAEHNIHKLHASGQPVAILKAVHNVPGAFKATSEEAGGLVSVICIAQGAKVMLCANLWVDVGMVNCVSGTIVAIWSSLTAILVQHSQMAQFPSAHCVAHGLQATTSVQDCRFCSSWPWLSPSTNLKE